MKTCSKCGEEKSLVEYYLFSKSKDGHQKMCKQCMKISYNKCRLKKKDHYQQVQRDREKRNSERLMEWKHTQQCLHCENNNPITLDLHHRDPLEDDVWIADVFRNWSWKRLKEEIDKCDVLCANCHRIEHHRLRHLV